MIPIRYVQGVGEITLYIAGKWEARLRLREMANVLRLGGYRVTSSWLDRPESESYKVGDSVTQATLDLDEIDESNLFILDTMDENATGGANVEFGYALAHSADRALIVVGPERNIFHPMAVHFTDWPEALETLFHPYTLYMKVLQIG